MRTRNVPVYPHFCNIFVTIFKHNTSSSTTNTRRFGIVGVDRPLILSLWLSENLRINLRQEGIYERFFFGGRCKRWKRHPQTKTRNVKAKYLRKNMLCINNIMMMCFKHLSLSPPPQKTSSPSLPQTSREGLDGLLSFSSS